MDARITKHRLGNMLSYDWLKILCTIAAAVTLIVLLFTMVSPRPARAQNFYVHLYGEFEYGDDYAYLTDTLETDVVSYDVLDVKVESFGNGAMDGASYTARRSAGEGSVAISADYTSSENGVTPFADLIATGMYHYGQADEALNIFFHLDEYFPALEQYLARFFGENWRTGEIDRAEAERCFRARNVDGPNNKNRFRSEAQIAAGIEEEVKRLQTLRDNYVFLLDKGLGGENLPFVSYTSVPDPDKGGTAKTYCVGVGLGRLARIGDLFAYRDKDGNNAREKLVFLIYNNGKESYDNGTNDGREDLGYEAVSMLRYLVENYS